MSEYKLRIAEDEIIVLLEFFNRFEEKERLYFVHHAEYLALMRLAGQLEYPTYEILKATDDKPFSESLNEARERVAKDFESDFPELEKE